VFLDFGFLEAVIEVFLPHLGGLLAWKGYLLVPQCLKTAPYVLTGLLQVASVFRHSAN
jgi:hypothetical protein